MNKIRQMRIREYSFLLIFINSIAFGQYSINPTRPSASDNAFITSAGYSEVEIGGLISENFYSVPALIKFSPNKNYEIGTSFSGLINYTVIGDQNKTNFGDFGLQLKVPLFLFENMGNSIVGKVEFPSNLRPKYTFYFVYSFIGNTGQFDATFGTVFIDNALKYENSFIYAFAFSPELKLPVGFFAELFGESINNNTPIYLDVGISYPLSKTLILDLAFAKGLNNKAADWSLLFGMTSKLFRIN